MGQHFQIGDRVQVSEQLPYFEEVRGVTGVISPLPDGSLLDLADGQYWVEFDTPVPSRRDCVSLGGGFWERDLTRID